MTAARLFALLLLASVSMGGLSGCAVNPATGGSSFTAGMTTAQEIEIGREQHPKIVKQFGGQYGSPALRRYVSDVGRRLAGTTERKDLTYKFTVLNSPIVNAFATPGGYVYITRGLLALADNEAQLAGVLAHELGHQTALHHARRFGQGLLTSVLVSTLGGARVGQMAGGALLRSFSRDHELEADDLGLRYMTRVGYDPNELAGFLSKLRAKARLRAKLLRRKPDEVDQFDFLATHPAPTERVRRAASKAKAYPSRAAVATSDRYLRRIDNILYGDDPRHGFVRGQEFAHPKLKFRFAVPEEFRLFNTSKAVVGVGPDGARIIFDGASAGKAKAGKKNKKGKKARNGKTQTVPSARHYLTKVWAKKVPLHNLRTLRVDGLDAAMGIAGRLKTRKGAVDVQLAVIRINSRTVYRFIFATPPALTKKLGDRLRRTVRSFRRLSAAEARALKPLRLRIVRVKRGNTVWSLSRRMAEKDFAVERFRLLNGLGKNQSPKPGQMVKIVTE